ncbi:LysR family transcriptional regulator [Streptomyces chartreusis]|uniref:LysR family transcriptional regulator n=1 Tax=Streptomyces chartreusis TaxID=1969 RepID=A0A7H8T355_STRCX|nr:MULTISPECIES: LysR family transcriptional regulator [Streptomyces]MBT1091102.1 LysR family transcriptional regulator [Streptomyces sp. Tu102]QEV66920.1 LysR family transcriptional regulator [Streptomyces chartreusis]QKZ17913.1 LysR family transcriptional regulator [Streptomyces chartreusis]RSO05519.1 LysR family transcriptional regulator [Streptomyces sp. WAC 05379]GGX04552.1 LysR family transcriptional regulator [Streptomyces chartreusis]
MDERQLRILRELGELGSVTAVAEALLVTPSAISQQLRLLQRSIPVPLTERQGRRLVLTDAGQALAGAAVEVETALARARHAVEEFVQRPDGEVSVAAFHSAGTAFFPLLLRALAGAGRPAPRLVDEDVPQEDFPRLTREYDIVLAHRLDHAPPWPDTVAATTLLREPLDVAMPADHPLAAKRRVTPRDVADESWITVHDGFPVLAVIEAIAAAAGRRLHLAHRINEFAVVAQVVAAGGGIALMPRWTMPRHPALTLRPLSGVQARRHIDALYRPERTARSAVRTVLTELRHAASDIQSRLSEGGVTP